MVSAEGEERQSTQSADAKPALVRVDGNGELDVIDLAPLKSTRAALPNAPAATTGRRNPRAESITGMSFVNGKLIVAALSIGYETIASMTRIEQMDMLDAQRSIVIAPASGALNLRAVPLP